MAYSDPQAVFGYKAPVVLPISAHWWFLVFLGIDKQGKKLPPSKNTLSTSVVQLHSPKLHQLDGEEAAAASRESYV